MTLPQIQLADDGLPLCACGNRVEFQDWQLRDEKRCPGCIAEARAQRLADKALAMLPEAFSWARRGTPELEAAIIGARVLDEDLTRLRESVRVTFSGPPRVGKTALAVALFRDFVEHRRPGWESARFEDSRELGRARMEHPLGEKVPLVELAKSCGLLVIDDLGNEHVLRDHACLDDIISARHKSNYLTWITTGLAVDEISVRYDAGTGRRVFVDAVHLRLGRKIGH